MQLIGMLDSPFVRRVAITMRYLGIEYEHRPMSIFRTYDEFREVHPLVKVPTLVCDDGEMLVDSTLIIDFLETAAGHSLMPAHAEGRRDALQKIGIALVAMEKVANLIYETKQRPVEMQYAPWVARLEQQLQGAIGLLEQAVADGNTWFSGDEPNQADITVAVAWRFVQNVVPDIVVADSYPGLVAYSARAEALPEFIACPLE